jgi:inner membrane protein
VPSPLGHALVGFAAGWVAGPAACRTAPDAGPERKPGILATLARWRWPVAFAAAGVAADLDLLVGLHSRYTHSVGAALLVFAGAWLMLRGRVCRPAAASLALGLSYGSHVLLDWLATDTSPPIGIMALWPFSRDFYLSPVTVFMGISRKYWLAAAWTQNAASVAWELLILLPVIGAALWMRRPGMRNLPPEPAAGWQKSQH